MQLAKRLFVTTVEIGITIGFAGIGVLGLGLILAMLLYPTGLFWSLIMLLMGLLGVALAVAMGMTVRNAPDETAAPTP